MKWEELSMKDRAKYIALGVQSGITDINSIRDTYNSYAIGGGVEVRGTSGNTLGTFASREEAEQYIANNSLEQHFYEPELNEVVVTPKRSTIDMAKENFKETFGISAKDAASFIPFVGDALDIRDIGSDISKGDYKNAAIGTALLLLPEMLAKPIKSGYRYIKNQGKYFVDDIRHFDRTRKAISEGRYTPFMSRKKTREFRRGIQERLENEVYPFTRQVAEANLARRNETVRTPFAVWGEDPSKSLPSGMPSISFKHNPSIGRNEVSGWYEPENRAIMLRDADGHILLDPREILETGSHEYGHHFMSPDQRIQKFDTNPKEVKSIFDPIAIKREGLVNTSDLGYDWFEYPEEVMAEVYRHKYRHNSPGLITADSPILDDVSESLARDFSITPLEAREMLIRMGEKGFKHGGKLKRIK